MNTDSTSEFRIDVRGVWAGRVTSGWVPAIAGTLNQTGESDERASTFGSREEAQRVMDELVAPRLYPWDWRIVEIGGAS